MSSAAAADPDRARRRRPATVAALALGVFLVHAASPVHQSGDSMYTIPTAASILYEGDTDLDEYRDLIALRDPYPIEEHGGHLYNRYPIGPSLLAAPFVLAIDASLAAALRTWPALEPWIRERVVAFLVSQPGRDPDLVQAKLAFYRTRPIDSVYLLQKVEVVIASAVVAVLFVALYLVARHRLSHRAALGVAAIACFGTSLYSTASRALWQHGPSALALTVALLLLLGAGTRPRLAALAALPLAISFLFRPWNALSILALTLYVANHHRRQLWRYLAWASPVAAALLVHNLAVYGTWLAPYYAPRGRLDLGADLGEALIGSLASPWRGLFVYSPVLLFALAGAWLTLRQRPRNPLDGYLVAVLLGHWLLIAITPVWTAGYAYGPRYFTDVVPYLVYFLLPVAARLFPPRAAGHVGRVSGLRLGRALFFLAVGFSLFAHARGATSWAALGWNPEGQTLALLWDWRNAPFLR